MFKKKSTSGVYQSQSLLDMIET